MSVINPSPSIDSHRVQWEDPLPVSEERDTTTWPDGAGYTAEGLGVDGNTGGALELPSAGFEDMKTGLGLWRTDPSDSILLAIVIIISAAKLGEIVAKRLGIPQVVGELVMGIILGNIYLFSGWDFFNFLHEMPFLKILSGIGAIVLLLVVGINTDLRAMLKVGLSALLVTLGGILAPVGLGCLISYFLLPGASLNTHLFLMAILCTSSVAIKLKVFDELGKLQSIEARISIASAVLNEIIILLFLAAIVGITTRGRFSAVHVAVMGTSAVAFLIGFGMVSLWFGESIGDLVTRRCPEGIKIFIIVVACLGLTYLAEMVGLATIIGAFGAGLLLRYVKTKSLTGKYRSMDELVRPTYLVVVPIFFVIAGAQVRLESFMDMDAVLLGLSITGAAVLGKLFCSFCVIERGANRLAIGIAMVARLEVALVVASVGKSLGALSDTLFAAATIMVAITATMSPPLMKLALTRAKEFVPEKAPVPYGLSNESRKKFLMLRQLGRR